MEVTSHWAQRLLEEWGKQMGSRYPVVVVVPSGPGKITLEALTEFTTLISADILDFEERYGGRLSAFIGRADIAEEIVGFAEGKPAVVINVEHFYDKWDVQERLSFIRHILRRDGHAGIVLLLHCQESLSPIVKDVAPNERGAIWNP